MRRFVRILFGVTAISQLPFVAAVALLLSFAIPAPVAWSISAGVGIAMVVLLRARLRLVMDDRPVSGARRSVERLYFMHWGAALASLPASIVTLAIAASIGQPLALALALGYASSLTVAFYAVWIRPEWPRIQRIDVPIEGLASSFDGYRIAQLSDVHVGSLCPPSRVMRWVGRANDEKVDLIALTGDYVTSGTRFHAEAARLFGELRARDGVAAVMGNHDYSGGGEPLRTELVAHGIKLLSNERFVIERQGDRLEIAGVDDTYTRRADVEKTLEGLSTGQAVVTLAHDPKLFPALAKHGASLVLSGHTHWGQIGAPYLAKRVNLARRFFRFAAGTYRDGAATLYVNPGLGTTGPPIRWGVPPEITVITLRTPRSARADTATRGDSVGYSMNDPSERKRR